jgi:hydrogenase maturation factor
MLDNCGGIRCLREATRGGIVCVLNEYRRLTGLGA